MNQLLEHLCAEGPVDYAQYIERALYAPECGYYTRQRARVGRCPQTDFYTAESLGAVFAELVASAAGSVLGSNAARASHQFVEIAAEPDDRLLQRLPGPCPFRETVEIRQGDDLKVEGPSIVFANEWLDALPFHRLIFVEGAWRERGVYWSDGRLQECLLPEFSPPVAAASARLPAEAEEGYQLDWPLQAEAALEALLAQTWTGALLLFDYGRSWASLTADLPEGTARTYQQHQTGSDLLAAPGEQDITCDVCWDPLVRIAKAAGFHDVQVRRQEAFFMEAASGALQKIIEADAGKFSSARQTVLELVHPGNMGHRFQVLSAVR